MTQQISRTERFRGVISGTAVGDSVGLPAEGISRTRAQKLFKGPWRHRLLYFPGTKRKYFGMVSDDTEHTVFVAQSLLAHPDSPALFAKRLSRCLRWWLVSVPAGIGFATLRSVFRLWAGISPAKSGVFSAGNGPAMRSAPIGAFFASDTGQLDAYLEASTNITHTDPKALTGAKAIAYLTAWTVRENLAERPCPDDFLEILGSAGQDEEWTELVSLVSSAVEQHFSVSRFADSLGLSNGITGYVYHTVPVVVYAWYLHFGNFEETLSAVLDCGGDTDTTGAIVGALAGAVVGEQGIPGDWLEGIWEWPRGIKVLRKIADALEAKSRFETGNLMPVRYFRPGIIFRNLFFLATVLLHGFRRLLPPY
ncbi:MAG: ADP-ribosylglycohydrolase family protein [Desulfobacteraceae bacterium]|nr:ADP-ribosylglycohydrolase family protein [Desulfobacteraceae bacterium]